MLSYRFSLNSRFLKLGEGVKNIGNYEAICFLAVVQEITLSFNQIYIDLLNFNNNINNIKQVRNLNLKSSKK